MNKNLVIEELIKGRKLATQIGALLEERTSGRELVDEIMASISRALAVLGGKVKENDENKESFDGKTTIESTRRERCRKRSHPHSWSRTKAKTLDDGRSWRKYGQKEIHQAKFPRSYFRCTHKFDQGCKATRQVQQSEDDPSSYIITYFGKHTCRASEEILFSSLNCPEENPCMIDFSTNITTTNNCQRPQFSFMEQEYNNFEEVDSNINIETPGSSSSDTLELPADMGTLEEYLGLRSTSIDQTLDIWDFGEHSCDDDMFCFESS